MMIESCGTGGPHRAAFLVDNRFAGLNVVPDLLEQLVLKIVRSYALDALDGESLRTGDEGAADRRGFTDLETLKETVEQLSELQASRHSALGRGEDIRLRSGKMVGTALAADGVIVHLGLWAAGLPLIANIS